MKKTLIIITTMLLLSSCAVHHGLISTSSINRNVKYVDIAYGVSQTKMLFGIGGLSQDALVLEAKRELVKNRPLKANEEYANFTVDFKRSFFPFYSITKVTVSADVVRFINDSISNPVSQDYKDKLASRYLSNSLFEVGDSVIFDKRKIGTIISFLNANNVRIEYKTKSDKTRTKKISLKDIYSPKKTYKGYKAGDNFDYYLRNDKKARGKIVGLGLKYLLIKTIDNNISQFDYEGY